MKKQIIFYTISTAIDKGAILLFFPIVTMFLSLENFGLWSLILVLANLLIPIVTLNGSSSILRDGSEDKYVANTLLKYFILLSIICGVFFLFIRYILNLDYWIMYSISISILDGILFLLLTYYRTLEKAKTYFLIILMKTSILFTLLLYAKVNNFNLDKLMNLHLLLLFSYLLVILIVTLSRPFSFNSKRVVFLPILLFSITLIPHGMSQWILSSSDRLIIEYMINSKSVGIYSLAYNLSMILMLISTALALALPTYMIKNFKKWKDNDYDNIFFTKYTHVSIILYVFILIFYFIDYRYTRILGYYGIEMLPLISIIFTSIYVMGIYYFYVNYLFYYKKAKIISLTTFYSAILNIILTIPFIYFFDIYGAALSTLLSYIYYVYKIKKETLNIEKNLNIKLKGNICIFSISIILITTGVYYVL